jgi:hypothetical protein
MGGKREATVKGNAKEGGSGVEAKEGTLKEELRLEEGLRVSCAEKGRLALAGIQRKKPLVRPRGELVE